MPLAWAVRMLIDPNWRDAPPLAVEIGLRIINNKKHLKWFNDLDQKLRRKMGFTPACEACGIERAQPRCVKKECSKGKQVNLK